jgi:hypothetical protein
MGEGEVHRIHRMSHDMNVQCSQTSGHPRLQPLLTPGMFTTSKAISYIWPKSTGWSCPGTLIFRGSVSSNRST